MRKSERILNIRKPDIDKRPIEEQQHDAMRSIAKALDYEFNGDVRGDKRKVGFVLLIFPADDPTKPANLITNGVLERDEILEVMKIKIKSLEAN